MKKEWDFFFSVYMYFVDLHLMCIMERKQKMKEKVEERYKDVTILMTKKWCMNQI